MLDGAPLVLLDITFISSCTVLIGLHISKSACQGCLCDDDVPVVAGLAEMLWALSWWDERLFTIFWNHLP